MLIALLVMAAGASLLVAKDLAVSLGGLILVIVGCALMVSAGSQLWEVLGCAVIMVALAIGLLWKGNPTPHRPIQDRAASQDEV